MKNNCLKSIQTETYIDITNNHFKFIKNNMNKLNNLYNNFILTNEIILNYLYDDNGLVISNNKITLRFNIKIYEIHYVEIEYIDTFIIRFIPRKEHTNQNQIVKYINKEIYVIEYFLHIIEQLKKSEKIVLNILFLTEKFLTKELTKDEFNVLA